MMLFLYLMALLGAVTGFQIPSGKLKDEHNATIPETVKLSRNCPDACECYYRKIDRKSVLFIDCEGKNLPFVPGGIPLNANRIFLQRNAISVISEDNFKNLKDVTHLILNWNSIYSIQKGSFQCLQNLRVLELGWNRRFKEFEPETFLNLNSLEELSLKSMSLSNLGKNTFKGLRGLKKLELTSNNISFIDSSTFNDMNSLQFLDLSFNQYLGNLPNKTFNLLRNLKSLFLNLSGLTNLEEDTFHGLYNLKELVLSDNNITCIHPKTFSDLSRREILDLSFNNYLEEFHSEMFTSLHSLLKCDLSATNIRRLEGNIFAGFTSVQELLLSDNNISYIDNNSFSSMIHLEKLNLQNNNLYELQPDTFRNQKYLAELHLRKAGLSKFRSKTINALPNLTYLALSQNNLSSFLVNPFNFTQPTSQIIELHIDDMQIKTFDLSYFHYLEILNASYNMIYSIKRVNFTNNHNLRKLNFRMNLIGVLDGDVFSDLRSLTRLDLAYNRLTVLPHNVFSNLTALQVLYLQYNKIDEFIGESYSLLSALEELKLSGNRLVRLEAFHHESNSSTLPKLKHLNLNGCSIKKLNFIPIGMESIEQLELNANNISDVPDNSFLRFPKLESLSMQFNEFKVNGLSFNSLSLKRLSLANTIFHRSPPDASIDLPEILEFLDLSKSTSQVSDIGEPTHLPNLKTLHVKDMKINSLSGFLIHMSPHLQELDLSDNFLVELDRDFFYSLTNLTTLGLARNLIASINSSSLPEIAQKRIKQLDLSENPFDCDCDILWLRRWLQKLSASQDLSLYNKYKCNSPANLKGRNIFDVTIYTELGCFTNPHNDWILTALYFVVAAFFVPSFMTSCIYKYKWAVRYLHYFTGKKINYEYDAFIAFYQDDHNWVHRVLKRRLQADPQGLDKRLNIYVPDRVWPDRPDILEKVQKSRKTVLVLSKTFFKKSDWSHLKLLMFKDKNDIVVIQIKEPNTEDIKTIGENRPTETLEENTETLKENIPLNNLMKHCTCLHYNVKWEKNNKKLFWMNLRKLLA